MQANFDFRGAKNDAAGRMLTVTLPMIDLAQRSEPYEIALPYGLTVTVKPLATAGMATAQSALAGLSRRSRRQVRERMEAGLPPDGLPDLSADGERDGFYRPQLIRELAVRHVRADRC